MGTEVGTHALHPSNGLHTSTGGSLPSALEGLVADVHMESTNYLTKNRVYAQTGRTEVLAAEPGVIHFGGLANPELTQKEAEEWKAPAHECSWAHDLAGLLCA
eukprot:1160763-Pelagomonas_calceolata.AAC.7